MPKKKVPEPVVPETEVLFPEQYTWTMEQFMRLSGALFTLVQGLLNLGLTEENAEAFLNQDFAMLAPAIAPIIPEVLAVTLRFSPEEVAKISIGQKSALAIKILLLNKQNQEEIKNFFAEFFSRENSANLIH